MYGNVNVFSTLNFSFSSINEHLEKNFFFINNVNNLCLSNFHENSQKFRLCNISSNNNFHCVFFFQIKQFFLWREKKKKKKVTKVDAFERARLPMEG